MRDVSEKLLSLVEVAEPRLRQIRERESIQPILQGGWSRKQVIGHLIDSASNNHQRFVRAALQTTLDFPGYDQSGSVRVQAVQSAGWHLLEFLVTDYLTHLVHHLSQLGAANPEVAHTVLSQFGSSSYDVHASRLTVNECAQFDECKVF